MTEFYSSKERLTIFLVLYAVALIISFIYLFRSVDRKQISIIIFIISLIYASAFVYLNFLAVFDLIYTTEKGFEKFLNTISIFYKIFSWIDKALGFILFNILICYLESGYYEINKKILDIFIRIYNSIKKLTICQIIVKLAIAIPLISIILVFLIVNRDKYGLGKNPLDYIEIILDCYSIFEIYTCVGFFILQLIKDCKTQKSNKLMNRYYNYTLMKIVEKTEKYFCKIKNTYKVLDKTVTSFDKNNRNSYYNYLKDTLQDIKETMNYYGIEEINFNFNVSEDNLTNNNNNSNLTDNTIHKISINRTENKEERAQKIKKSKEEGKEEDLPTCIRKYKKSLRRINKLKKLYKEIEKEKEKEKKKDDLKNGNSRKCSCVYKLLFIPFSIVILTDFLMLIILDGFSLNRDEKENKKEGNYLSLILSILISVPLTAICTSYTIITIYSTTRRRYISGDFLYDKQINDDLSLLKTVQIICGYSFALVYCNLFLWKTIDTTGEFYGKPGFYGEIIIPDYTIKYGISVFMIIKIIIIIATIIISLFFSNFFVFKNDLADFNLSGDESIYDNEKELKTFLEKEINISNFLKKN